MRCLACGAEMRLEEVARDETVPVSGFMRHTFECSVCGDIEQRLAFIGRVEPSNVDAIPLHSAPPVSPLPAAENEDTAAPSVAKRLFANLSRIYHAVGSRLIHRRASLSPGSDLATAHTSAPPYESVSVPNTPPTISPALVLRKIDNDRGECENLLRSAIETVRAPTYSSQPSTSLPEAESATPVIVTSLSEAELAAPNIATGLSEAEPAAPIIATGLPEAEPAAPIIATSLPEIGSAPPAIATSPSEAESAGPAITSSLPEPGSATPAELASSIRAERSPASRGVVQIQYDPVKAKYAAMDIKTGLRILRHYDSARLRAMCDRMGWQVVDGELTSESYWSQVPKRTNTVHRLNRERTSGDRRK
jgi:hypothetical protein